ncbi:hypothetical protein AAZX31_20G199300 [Glycine max]
MEARIGSVLSTSIPRNRFFLSIDTQPASNTTWIMVGRQEEAEEGAYYRNTFFLISELLFSKRHSGSLGQNSSSN